MIRFITGRSGSGKSETVTREVCDLINNTGREVVVIVPEQETVVWERKFAGLLKPSSNLRLEVTNFTNLARSVFREFGGLADSIIDDGSRILIMWRAMLSVWNSLLSLEVRIFRNGFRKFCFKVGLVNVVLVKNAVVRRVDEGHIR